MLDTAMAVASPEALHEWQTICEKYRATQPADLIELSSEAPLYTSTAVHVRDKRPKIQHFYFAFQAVNHGIANEYIAAIHHRLSLADLHDAYVAASEDVNHHSGELRGVVFRSSTKIELFGVLYPKWVEVRRPQHDKLTRAAFKRFSHTLTSGHRWSCVRQRLGRAALGLMPQKRISHTFIEQTLKIGQLHLWLDLVERCNPHYREIMEPFMAKLMDTIPTHTAPVTRLSRKRLKLERMSLTEIRDEPDWSGLFDDADELVQTSGDEAQLEIQPSQLVIADFPWNGMGNSVPREVEADQPGYSGLAA